MVEIEGVFLTLKQIIALTDKLVRSAIKFLIKKYPLELKLIQQIISNKNENNDRLQELATIKKIPIITWKKANKILGISPQKGSLGEKREFTFSEEQELLKRTNSLMLFLTHFPDRSDHFYAKIDKKKNNPAINKVRKFDLIARDCGEIAGGGEREDSYYKLKKRISTLPKNISKELK